MMTATSANRYPEAPEHGGEDLPVTPWRRAPRHRGWLPDRPEEVERQEGEEQQGRGEAKVAECNASRSAALGRGIDGRLVGVPGGAEQLTGLTVEGVDEGLMG